jgi:hypothetical protein
MFPLPVFDLGAFQFFYCSLFTLLIDSFPSIFPKVMLTLSKEGKSKKNNPHPGRFLHGVFAPEGHRLLSPGGKGQRGGNRVDIITLTWINTLVILAVIGVNFALGLYLGWRIVEALARIEDTASRNERLTLAVLERLAPSSEGRA